jgi:hypothetical protein
LASKRAVPVPQPRRYRKKPVVIEAFQWQPADPMTAAFLAGWLAAAGCDFRIDGYGDQCVVKIATLEGEMTASPGDFIIRGVQGEFYPCKPDIFAASYEEVPDGGA